MDNLPENITTFGAKNVTFKVKMLWLRFWATFYFSSGRTDWGSNRVCLC